MTYEEAHTYLENLQRELTEHRDVYSNKLIEANGKAILAIEKQIPKQTKIETSPGEFIESYYCPVCGRYFGDKARNCVILFHTPKYCECGQALKWGD